MRKQDLPPLDPSGLFQVLVDLLAKAHEASASEAFAGLGVDLETTPEAALRYARERAAELVGKKWIAGELVDNPNPEFAISGTLRADVQAKVTQAVAEGWSPQELTSALQEAFGPWRAETIARTETGFAYAEGAAVAYETAGVDLVEIVDGEGCLPDGHQDGAPLPAGSAAVIESAAQADGQIWTLAQYRQHPLGHPNCVRAAVPYFEEKVA